MIHKQLTTNTQLTTQHSIIYMYTIQASNNIYKQYYMYNVYIYIYILLLLVVVLYIYIYNTSKYNIMYTQTTNNTAPAAPAVRANIKDNVIILYYNSSYNMIII